MGFFVFCFLIVLGVIILKLLLVFFFCFIFGVVVSLESVLVLFVWVRERLYFLFMRVVCVVLRVFMFLRL